MKAFLLTFPILISLLIAGGGAAIWHQHNQITILQNQVNSMRGKQDQLSARVDRQEKRQKYLNKYQAVLDENQGLLAKAVQSIIKAILDGPPEEKPSSLSNHKDQS